MDRPVRAGALKVTCPVFWPVVDLSNSLLQKEGCRCASCWGLEEGREWRRARVLGRTGHYRVGWRKLSAPLVSSGSAVVLAETTGGQQHSHHPVSMLSELHLEEETALGIGRMKASPHGSLHLQAVWCQLSKSSWASVLWEAGRQVCFQTRCLGMFSLGQDQPGMTRAAVNPHSTLVAHHPSSHRSPSTPSPRPSGTQCL